MEVVFFVNQKREQVEVQKALAAGRTAGVETEHPEIRKKGLLHIVLVESAAAILKIKRIIK